MLTNYLTTLNMDLNPRFKGIPGRIRKPGLPGEIVWIRGKTPGVEDSIYNPTPPRHVRKCLQETMDWFSDLEFSKLSAAGMGMPLVERSRSSVPPLPSFWF